MLCGANCKAENIFRGKKNSRGIKEEDKEKEKEGIQIKEEGL